MPHESMEEMIDREWEAREKHQEEVRLRLRRGWRNDEGMLLQYFAACVNNWKTFKGDRKPEHVLKLYGIYKQATVGDCTEPEPKNLKSAAGQKWESWTSFRGQSKQMAMRRFITLLAQIDPLLIDVMPSEKPPDGFPHDRQGRPICAKCNTHVGCNRPILDQHGIDIRAQLFETPALQEGNLLMEWAKNALENQRCVWGVHKPVFAADIKPFQSWFKRPENQGFFQYDNLPIMQIVKDLMVYHYGVVWDMQCNKNEYHRDEFNAQAKKCESIRQVYNALTGEDFVYEAPCTSDNELCNARRKADGGKNHTHPVEIDKPVQAEVNTHQEAITLRLQCGELGLDTHIGVEPNIEKRCEIYRTRIAEHFKRLQLVQEARARNEGRKEKRLEERKLITSLKKEMNKRQVWDACHTLNVDHLCRLVKAGADPLSESPRGITPLISLVVSSAPLDLIEEFMHVRGMDPGKIANQINIHGMSALMIACRLRDTKMIHCLVKNGALCTADGKKRGKEMTPLHWCAVHGYEEGAQILKDYVLDQGGDSLRTARFLDCATTNNQTPLMLAASRRKGLMCKILTGLGANPQIRDNKGHTAAYMARERGWKEIADWLDSKKGAGIANLETYADSQFEKVNRYTSFKLRGHLESFGSQYLLLIQNRGTQSPLGPPSRANQFRLDRGERETKAQTEFVDTVYNLFIDENRDPDYSTNEDAQVKISLLKDKLQEMVDLVKAGNADPNFECLAKPLPWTPLMCAAALNDTKSARLIIRQGGDPNYPNRDGTTALMLAAQLQCLDVMIDLLSYGGNLKAVDNEGYTPMAYANSLPVPTSMQQNAVSFMLEGDTHGITKQSSSDILKTAITWGINDLKDELEQNREQTSYEVLNNHLKFLRLMEKNGLTRIESLSGFNKQVKSLPWRITQLEEKRRIHEDWSESSSELREREERERRMKLIEAEKDAKEQEDKNTMRCPLCTLILPCPHFFRLDTLKRYLYKEEQKDVERQKAMKGKKLVNSLGIKTIDRGAVVLEEAGLNNRDTDRTQDIFHNFHAREMQLAEEAALLKSREKVKQKAIEEGKWEDWSIVYVPISPDATDSEEKEKMKFYVNNNNFSVDERWSEHFDEGSKRRYYHRSDTNETVWTNPITGEEDEPEIMVEMALREELSQFQLAEDAPATLFDTFNRSFRRVITIEDIEYMVNPTTNHGRLVYQSLKAHVSWPKRDVCKLFDFVREKGKDGVDKKTFIERLESSEFLQSVSDLKDRMENETKAMEEELLRRQNAMMGIVTHDSVDKENSSDDEHEIFEKEQTEVKSVTILPTPGIKSALKSIDKTNDETEGKTQKKVRFVLPDGHGVNDHPTRSDKDLLHNYVDAFHDATQLDETGNPPNLDDLALVVATDEKDECSIMEEPEPAKVPKFLQVGENPVPVKGRSVLMFTNDFFSRNGSTDGLRGMQTRSARHKQAQNENEIIPSIQISGWVFVSLFNFDEVKPPVEKVRMKKGKWAELMNHLRTKLNDVWVPSMRFEPLAEVTSWKCPSELRCKICVIGYCRFNSSELKGPNDMICLTCTIRKELYIKCKETFPDTFKSSDVMSWPFKYESFADFVDDPYDGQYEPQSSPVRSLLMEKIDAIESTKNGKNIEISENGSIVHPNEATEDAKSSGRPDIMLTKSRADDSSADNSVDSAYTHPYSCSDVSSVVSDPLRDGNKYGVRELKVIPYLISKGHFNEAERMIRIAIKAPDFNEGEGIINLANLMNFQAEMYKLMGLWPLAVSIYIDIVDLVAPMMGYDDELTQAALLRVTDSLRRMKFAAFAKRYLSGLVKALNSKAYGAHKVGFADKIVELEKKSIIRLEEMDNDIIGEFKRKVPLRKNMRRCFMIHGIGSMWNMYLSTNGYCIVAKMAFTEFCEEYDSIRDYASFLDYYFRIRNILDMTSELFRHFIQHLIQKLLSKHVNTDLSKDAHNNHIWKHHERVQIEQYLQNGEHFKLGIFDSLVIVSMTKLAPIFRTFFYSIDGALVRTKQMQIDPEALFLNVTMIQTAYRAYIARRHVAMVRLAKLTEDRRRREADIAKYKIDK